MRRKSGSGGGYTKGEPEPGYLDTDAKQRRREATGRIIREVFGYRRKIAVFVLPYYDAWCAATIDKYVPKAEFYGTDWLSTVAENVAELDGGKKISMQGIGRGVSVKRYISTMSITFDAAWLDYVGSYNVKRAAEITAFADKMMRPRSVFAITVSGRASSLDRITQDVKSRLLTVVKSVNLVENTAYTTPTAMIYMIFLLDKG